MSEKTNRSVRVTHNNNDYLINFHFFDNDLRIDSILRHYVFSFYIFSFQVCFSIYRKVKQNKLPLSLYNSIITSIKNDTITH